MYFTHLGAFTPKEYAGSCAQSSFLSNWITIDAHCGFNFRIGNVNDIRTSVGTYTQIFQHQWTEQWLYWMLVGKPCNPIQPIFIHAYERLLTTRSRYRKVGFLIYGDMLNPLNGHERFPLVHLDNPYFFDDHFDREKKEFCFFPRASNAVL